MMKFPPILPPLKNPLIAQREYRDVLDALGEGRIVASHIWVVITQEGIETRKWTFANLPDYLALTAVKNSGVRLNKVWSEDPHRRPSIGSTTGNVRMVLRGGTPINLTDFILACCRDTELYLTYKDTIVKLVLLPFSILRAHRRGMNNETRKKLDLIHNVLNPKE